MPKRYLIITSLLLYTVTAWFSEGYHHPDEHFQVIELANYKLGRSPAADLPWEYEAQIRPGLQPALACTIIKTAELTGIQNPFIQAFLMRLLSGFLCLWLYFGWAKRLDSQPGQAGDYLRWAVVLLWFVPYLSVRFSSENMAGLSFAGGLLLLLQGLEKRPARLLLAGFLLGLSFFFRYQMGFALAGMAAWLCWQWYGSGKFVKPASLLFAGFAAACILGFGSDIWLYGTYTFAPYNYFISNIVDNKAAYWGTSPWWFYFEQTVLTAVPPVSVLLLLFLGIGVWKKQAHVLVWSLLPFLLAHIVVGHKEMRFMYPMLLPVLALCVWGWMETVRWLAPRTTAWRWSRRFFVFSLVINCLLLPARSLLAAQESVACFRFLYNYAAEKPVRVYSHKKLLYEAVGLNMNFYRSPNIENLMYLDIKAKKIPDGALLLSQDLQLKNPPAGMQTERIYAYFPDWILNVNLNDWQSRTRMWSVHKAVGK
jgi:phosphatidylinositol glycan class B